MRGALGEPFSSLVLGLGTVFLVSPFGVAAYPGLFAAGFVLASLALIPRSPIRNPVR